MVTKNNLRTWCLRWRCRFVIYGCRNRRRELRVGSDRLCLLCLQMAAKMGDQPNMNSSSPVLDPSLYGFGGQKRSLDNGGQPSACTHPANITVEQLLQSGWFQLIFVFLNQGSIKFNLKSLNSNTGKSLCKWCYWTAGNKWRRRQHLSVPGWRGRSCCREKLHGCRLVELSRVVLLSHHTEEPSLHSDIESG